MSNYFNDAGEPLMDGAAMRYEMYLDSTYEPEPDYYDSYDEPEYLDPETCPHADVDFSGFTAECRGCETMGLRVVNNWPLDGTYDSETEDFILWPPQAGAYQPDGMEDQWLDSYMEDRISSMYE